MQWRSFQTFVGSRKQLSFKMSTGITQSVVPGCYNLSTKPKQNSTGALKDSGMLNIIVKWMQADRTR